MNKLERLLDKKEMIFARLRAAKNDKYRKHILYLLYDADTEHYDIIRQQITRKLNDITVKQDVKPTGES